MSSRLVAVLVVFVTFSSLRIQVVNAAEEGSRITFSAKNLFTTANGEFREWRIVSSKVFPGNLQSSYVEVEVDLASVDTGNESRDEHLRDPDFFEVETYPVAKVRAHSPELVGKDDRGRARYAAKFTIDLHGVEKTLDGEFSVLSESPITVEGSLVMDRLDFGIGGPRRFWNPVSITEEIPVSFRAALP